MESQRSLLFIALLIVSFMLYQQWQLDHAPVSTPTNASVEQIPTASANTTNDEFVPAGSELLPVASEKISANLVNVETDVLSLIINTQGGDIIEAKLKKYETEQGSGIPFTLMQNGEQKYIAQSGLTGSNGVDRLIQGRPIYQVAQTSYQLQDGATQIIVDLVYQDATALSVTKRFTFSANSYHVDVEYLLTNNTANNASVQMYGQLKQSTLVETSSGMIPTYRGTAYSTSEERYEKIDFDDIAEENLNKSTQAGWVAMIQHYFVSAWVPRAEETNQLYTSFTRNQDAVIGFKGPAITVPANGQATTSAILYLGPKHQDALAAIADGLDLTVDYGFLFMISQPLFWLLMQIQSFVGNWGIAIIVITLIVKGAMYPLTKAQYTSMAKMRELQPKMAALKDRYGDDRQKISQAMMELYRKEKVNPAGGCLPLLLQMPIFLALYWVFLESVELRHATFGLWLQDLSSKDPYFILPILMGASMYVMQKLQPMTVQDPMQQKMMQYMPLFFTIFFFWFPAGLVLYWLVSNLISIVQMKMIFNSMEKAKA